jgi:hypothetical protein
MREEYSISSSRNDQYGMLIQKEKEKEKEDTAA